jgi:ribosomal protein S18 acetylase RimI-like enzyme
VDPVDDLEHRCADAWPALADERLGEWRMRASGGFTGRANSTLTTGDPGVPIPEALRHTQEFAARHGIGPTAHVVVGSAAEPAVAAAGWRVNLDHPGGAESAVLVGSPAGFADSVSRRVIVDSVPPPGWWELAVGGEPTQAQRHVLGTAGTFGSVVLDGHVVAVVRGALVGDLLHIARLSVRPSHRRKGLARELLAGLAAWGAQRGATRCALQVAVHNTPAMHLYAALGCTEHHRYRYWVPA